MKKKIIIMGIGLIAILSYGYYFFSQTTHIENNNIQKIPEKADVEEVVPEEEPLLEQEKLPDFSNDFDKIEETEDHLEEANTDTEEKNEIVRPIENIDNSNEEEEQKENPKQVTGDTHINFEGMMEEINSAIDEKIKEGLPEENFEEKEEEKISKNTDMALEEKIKEIEKKIELS